MADWYRRLHEFASLILVARNYLLLATIPFPLLLPTAASCAAIKDPLWDRIRHVQIEGGLRELDRVAADTRAAAVERGSLIRQWQDVLTTIQRRDSDIAANATAAIGKIAARTRDAQDAAAALCPRLADARAVCGVGPPDLAAVAHLPVRLEGRHDFGGVADSFADQRT